jgi:hypothetical protein
MSKDLEIVLGSNEEAAWKKIRDSTKLELEATKRAIIISEEIIALADKQMAIEKEKFK